MTAQLEGNDIPVAERRKMLDVLHEVYADNKIDQDYGAMILPTEVQSYKLIYLYNRIVRPEHHLAPGDAQAMFTDPLVGQDLLHDGSAKVYPEAGFLIDDAERKDRSKYIGIECNQAEVINDRNDDVDVYHHFELSDDDLDIATRHLEWKDMKKLAIEHGYVAGQEQARGAPHQKAAIGRDKANEMRLQ